MFWPVPTKMPKRSNTTAKPQIVVKIPEVVLRHKIKVIRMVSSGPVLPR